MRYIFTVVLLSGCMSTVTVNDITYVGGVGDGLTDDTVALQESLTLCSKRKLTCVLAANKRFRITGPVYLYNDASLVGEPNSEVIIDFIDLTERFVFNLGIEGRQLPKPPFSGVIRDITFRAISGPTDKWQGPDRTPIAGRILQFWRAKHATVKNNKFFLAEFFYGATASQNNQLWLQGNELHQNITITQNVIYQDANAHGQECIGIGPAQHIIISYNKCVGAGDDLIGAHFVDGLTISHNTLYGVDGRIFMSDSTDVLVEGNHVERIASTLDGVWYRGDTLLYLGYESGAATHTRPGPAIIKNNTFVLPLESLDQGSIVSITGASDVVITGNVIRNESTTVGLKGFWLSPWRDSTTPDFEYDKYFIENVSIINNKFSGSHKLKMYQTDSCVGYKGFVDILFNKGQIGSLSCPSIVNHFGNETH